MTAYQLRQHLVRWHGIRLVGADFASLTKVHEIEHRHDTDHEHEVGE